MSIPLIRLANHPEFGLIPEATPRREYEILQYEWSVIALAEQWYSRRLREVAVVWPDIDDDEHRLKAFVDRDSAGEFVEASRELRRCRAQDAKDKVPTQHGYSWAPIHETTAFGYYAPVAGWLIPDQYGPVLLYREHDADALTAIDKLLSYWLAFPTPSAWPRPCAELANIVIPKSLEQTRIDPRLMRQPVRQRYRNKGRIKRLTRL